MLSRIFDEPLMSIINKHNYKTFAKSSPASLVHCIENVLSHSAGKCRDSVAIVDLSSTSGCPEFHLCTMLIH